MGILDRRRSRKDIELIVEEKIYAYVAQEMEAGKILQGLWAKATAQARSTAEADIHPVYIKLRVDMLRAEGRLINQFLRELEIEDKPKRMSFYQHYEKARENRLAREKAERKNGFSWGTLFIITIVVIWLLVAFLDK